MFELPSDCRPSVHASLSSFFQESIDCAIRNQGLYAAEATRWYLVNLCTEYARSERLFECTEDGPTLRPLAELYRSAVEATTEQQREQCMRRLGDVALFLGGLFSGRLRRKPVDVDYYISMGGCAYGYLCDRGECTLRGQAQVEVFRELAHRFGGFVDVLAEVGEKAHGSDSRDILRMYDLWLKTGSQRLERKLRERGITPTRFPQRH